MDTERAANKEYCFIVIKLRMDHQCKPILRRIYIVLQLFYIISECPGGIADRFVNYEENQFSDPFVALPHSINRTAAIL